MWKVVLEEDGTFLGGSGEVVVVVMVAMSAGREKLMRVRCRTKGRMYILSLRRSTCQMDIRMAWLEARRKCVCLRQCR